MNAVTEQKSRQEKVALERQLADARAGKEASDRLLHVEANFASELVRAIGPRRADQDVFARVAELLSIASQSAAAPDMLAALRKWREYDDLLRSLPGEGPLYGGQLAEVDAAYDACRDATTAALAKAEGH